MTLAGKKALVLGASRSMGRLFAEDLAARGAQVAVHYNSAGSAADARQVVAAIAAAGGRAQAWQADLSDLGALVGLFDAVESAFGGLDIVVNTAGRIAKMPVADMDEAEFDALHAVNTKAAFFVLREVARRLRDNGRVVSVSTSLSAATTGLYAAYAGGKAALEAYTRALAKEIGHRGITVNAICPGPLDTPFFHANASPEAAAWAKAQAPLNRLGEPADLVGIVRLLTGPDGQWINGQSILVNGGMVAR
ncbi:SDR family oxidoreductase [Magnetospirillum sp. 64-120]|uniref:SDR family oxidoreductase n=1 Tax=Magnetospirillum sp. 64-120 TaxID=1895778 RepID=UPI00092AC057|nr:SDR family oxidoreductase [Magnetospirillum sp. 64-120]OJX73820.1 MAG: short-chain dehydrogenase [Magnetospirillum sp. 64-120]